MSFLIYLFFFCPFLIHDLLISYRNNLLCNGLSLKSLAETVLNFPLDKSLLLRCSNWDAETLTEDQVFLIRVVEEWKSHCLWSIVVPVIIIFKYKYWVEIPEKRLTEDNWSVVCKWYLSNRVKESLLCFIFLNIYYMPGTSENIIFKIMNTMHN